MNPIRILAQFKSSLISFMDELITLLPDESDFIIGRMFISDSVNIEDVIKAFSLKIYENDDLLKKMIKTRDESFFLKNNVFSYFGDSKVNKFKDIWMQGRLDQEDKDTIWKWVDIFVVLTDKYYKRI
jgi:hypothetical protein